MRRIGRLKLSHQLLLLLLSIPVFLVASLLYYSASQHVTIRNKPLEQLALSTSSTVAEKIDRNLNDRYSDVQAFAFNALATEVLQGNSPDTLLEKFMNNMMSYYKCYDLMMLCDLSGKVLLLNTKDQHDQILHTSVLKGKNMQDREWFRSSIVIGGPIGGAYFSDFNTDDEVIFINGDKGYGVDFSAPVRNNEGRIIGVWRNRVSWKNVVQQIRKESETILRQNATGGLILLMDKQGHLIDADQENNILQVTIGKNNLMKPFDFEYAGTNINEEDFIYGWSESEGSYAYKGNKWKFLTLVPKVKFTDLDIYLQSDWTKLMAFSVFLLFVGVVLSFLFVRNFSKRIHKIKQAVQKLSEGAPELLESTKASDEIGEMSQAINILSHHFTKMAAFSSAIGEGNMSVSFIPLSEKDILGSSLLKMKKNLEVSQQEIVRQKWVSDTLTSFGELLREQQDPNLVYQKAISFLAKSVQAHQAAFFIVKHQNHFSEIELKAGYALSESRLNQPALLMGESYVGQCIQDNELLQLKNLPEDYSDKIHSGLGEFTPTEVLIIPVCFNHQSIGALEFSSFKPFEPILLKFLEKSSEYLGSYIAQIQMGVQKEMLRN